MESQKPPLAKKPAPKRKPAARKAGGDAKKVAVGNKQAITPPKGPAPAGPKTEKTDAPAKLFQFKGMFVKDLKPMLYGFGDSSTPLSQTVEVVEDVMLEYVSTMMHKALDLAGPYAKLTEQDLLYLVRKDPRKYSRARELMKLQMDLNQARKAFDDKEMVNSTAAAGGEEEEEGEEEEQ